MLVVDASVIVKLLVDEPDTDIARDIVAVRDDCIAPDLLAIEIASALAKKVRFDKLPKSHVKAGLKSFTEFVAELVESASLRETAVDLSIECDHSVFDCLYLALAIERGCTVLTADKQFAAKAIAAGYGSNIEMLR